MHTILTATDGSASAGRAVAFAAQLANAMQAQLVIFAASEGRAGSDLTAFSEAEHASIGDMLESELDGILGGACMQANDLQVPNVQTQRGIGDPATLILQKSKALGAVAIVVGKRGRGRLSGLLLGSVSQELVSLAPCPVVIVP